MLVLWAEKEAILNPDIPAMIKSAVGYEKCEVEILEGYGHRGHPTDAALNFLTATGKIINEKIRTLDYA